MKKIIVTGASGFLGQKLLEYLSTTLPHSELVAISRKAPENSPSNCRFVPWNGTTTGSWTNEFDGAFAVINLAGRSVNCRYNEQNKRDIMESRTTTTHLIGSAIEHAKNGPKVWLNAASATIYEHTEDAPNTEESTRIGHGFSVEVCKAWEEAFWSYKKLGIRQIALRTTIILGKNGGVTLPLRNLTKLGLGGKMGSGEQWFSWMHEDDFCSAVTYFLNNENCEGPYNMAAPHPIKNKELHKTLRKILRVPFGIPQPAWLLSFGAMLIGTETELVLKSRYVVSKRLKDEGFEFKFPTIESALENIFST